MFSQFSLSIAADMLPPSPTTVDTKNAVNARNSNSISWGEIENSRAF